ncbi:ornithine cyclodeaminase family protein [Mycetocola lacteus]|uniref:Ornithine cyclodeaminase family protein n=1 Tax=Mycetocola lacteus TaxID=76637 RepID=A0A3L7AWU3_9MICO|nr:ornithine cyclodeaminase family protein [Mycetocola lacteus]RLP83702.1 ornithine cyclodeaminase family protein [Mycetocola lacteus]
MTTVLLTGEDCARLVEWPGLIAAMREIHLDHARGVAIQPVPRSIRNPADTDPVPAQIIPMTGYRASTGGYVLKALADAPHNRERGIPAQRSTVALFSAETGECRALIDGAVLTRTRTAAVTVAATLALAPAGADVVTIVGAGALALEHARALVSAMPLREIRFWSRTPAGSDTAVATLSAEPAFARVSLSATTNLRAALDGAGIVCTLTPALDPLITPDLLGEDVHLNAVGSPPRPLFRELTPEVFGRAALTVVDALPIALAESGNIRDAIAAGTLAETEPVELGRILAGEVARPRGLSVFNSVGIGLQDLAAAEYFLGRSEAHEDGLQVQLRPVRTPVS